MFEDGLPTAAYEFEQLINANTQSVTTVSKKTPEELDVDVPTAADATFATKNVEDIYDKGQVTQVYLSDDIPIKDYLTSYEEIGELVRREDHEEAVREAVQQERRRILNELRDLEKDLQEENYEDRVIWGVAKEDQRKTAISALKEFKDSIVDIEKTIYINGEPVGLGELEEEVKASQ